MGYIEDVFTDLKGIIERGKEIMGQKYPDAEDIEYLMSDVEAAKDQLDMAYMELDDWYELERE